MNKSPLAARGINIAEIMSKYTIYLVLVLMLVAGRIITPNFLTWKNLSNVMRQVSVYCVLAFGMTILIITGLIDLSMGAVMALSGYMACSIFTTTSNLPLSILAAILISMVCGLINGLSVTVLRLPPFIATMSMDLIARGGVYIYSQGQPIYQIGDFNKLSTTYLFGILPTPAVIMIGIFLITLVLLRLTRLGRQLFAVGGNAEAARASGISIEKTKIKAYLISSVFVAIAGCLQMARINSALPDAAIGYHADAVAAAVVGGTAFGGGIGTASGTLVGGLIIGLLSNIMNLGGVQSYVQQVIRGLIIIFAVAWDIGSKSRKGKKPSVIAAKKGE